ncbi:phosphatase PAP2 family protein [Telmatospirillum sp. J64-1]|uniref:phosphatase PAP2 family protein n=1 Tax=Telmatospirillum sp. J64-1 TaxID=2502183 RepID=UPI00115F0DE3|nr:phosphatase PAP2 family protein [Telmatospirillum sp. J64-1]
MERHAFAGRQDRKILLLFGVALLAVMAAMVFVAITDEVTEGGGNELDQLVLFHLRVNGDPAHLVGPHWLVTAAQDITALGSFTVVYLFSAIAIFFLMLARRFRAALLVAVSVGGGTVLSIMLKDVFSRARPDIAWHVVETATASFPSSHATSAAVAYLTLGALLARMTPRLRLKLFIMGTAILLTVMIGLTRIYLGVHWLSDVVAGWALGAAWALLCWTVTLWLQTRIRIARPPPPEEP